jgi:hypothetical protein
MRDVRVWILAVTVALCSLPSVAFADDTEAFRDTITEATKLAYEGKFDAAIIKYIEAKTLRDDPVIDYNIARCYHKKGDCKAAMAAYKTFVSRVDAAEADVEAAQDYLVELGDCGVEAPIVEADPVLDPVEPDPVDPDPEPGAQTDEASAYEYTAWGLTIGGGVLLATGIALDLAGASLVDDYEAAAAAGDKSAYEGFRDDIEGRQFTVYTLYGLGAAATISGVVMLMLAPDDAGSAFVPTLLGPDSAGFVWGGRF